jgi:type IV pilus assembly protein PilW
MKRPTVLRQRAMGFSLVEVLVAAAIALTGLLVITQVFAAYEGWKRTTTGVAQSQEGGLLGAFTIEKDLRHAGLGMIGLRCAKINAYNAQATPNALALNGMPVTITLHTAANGSDVINVLYSSSPFANIVATLQASAPRSSSAIEVDNGIGFARGDLVVISQPSNDCSLIQLSDDAELTGMANVTGPGSSWALPHAPGNAFPWNPSGEQNIFPESPAIGYSTGAKVLNLGQLLEHTYYVYGDMLRMDERSLVDASQTSFDLIPGVVGLRARYGRDTDNDGVLDIFDNDTVDLLAKSLATESGNTLNAVQFALIVRSGQREKAPVSGASIAFWPGETLTLDDEARHYRYRVLQTIVPLKNLIWNN